MSALIVASLLAGASAQVQIPAPAPVPAPASTRREQLLAQWVPGEITCDNGRRFDSETINAPVPFRIRSLRFVSEQVTYEFTLGQEARALSIKLVNDEGGRRRISDIPPAIAGSPFPAMDASTTCNVTFTYETTPISEASLEDLVRMRSYNRNAHIPSSEWERFVSGNCSDKPRPRPLLIAYPDFREIPMPPGTKDWVFLSYATDAEGRTVDAEVVGSSGSEALNEAGLAALEQSRWTEAGREGCVRYFWSGTGVVDEPAKRELSSYGDSPEACDADDRWAKEPRLRYPNEYQRRGIQGWAVLRYDVAPWGDIGNVEVIDAQPAAELGNQAITVLTSAAFKPLEAGLKGCIERVVFRLPEDGSSNSSQPQSPDQNLDAASPAPD